MGFWQRLFGLRKSGSAVAAKEQSTSSISRRLAMGTAPSAAAELRALPAETVLGEAATAIRDATDDDSRAAALTFLKDAARLVEWKLALRVVTELLQDCEDETVGEHCARLISGFSTDALVEVAGRTRLSSVRTLAILEIEEPEHFEQLLENDLSQKHLAVMRMVLSELEKEPCWNCDGKGSVIVPGGAQFGDALFSGRGECEVCQGTGDAHGHAHSRLLERVTSMLPS